MEEKVKKSFKVKKIEDGVIQEGQEGQEANNNRRNRPNEEGNNSVASPKMKMSKKEALLEFRCMVEDAILGNYILEKPKKNVVTKKDAHRDISIWGVPLLPSKGHQGTDTVLLKFLMTNGFSVLDAFEKLRKTLKWRRDFKTDAILGEELCPDLENAVFINSVDKQGRPVCYETHGVFRDKELYGKLLSSEENRQKFLRWKIQSIEKSIKKLSFRAGGADSVVHITDLKHSPGPEMKELHAVSKKAFKLVQAHYPEIIHKHILINVPFWYYTSHIITSKLMSARTKMKFVFARPSKATHTLLKYISTEHLPVKYGGLNRDNDPDFLPEDKASEMAIAGNKTKRIKIPVSEAGETIVWDFSVVGWEVSYQEEFIPDDEGSYRVLLRKDKHKKSGSESVRNSFYISEPGKIVITIENLTLKKRRVFYRHKAIPTMSKFILFKKDSI